MAEDRKIQVVAGGTSGMGLETARALAQFGPVLVGGRNEKRLDGALAYLKDAGIEAYGKTVDVSDPASLAAFAEFAASLGTIGNVVNAAGVDYAGVDKATIIKINMLGTHYFLEAFLPYLDDTYVVNYSSITGYFYQPQPAEIELWDNPNDPDFVEKAIALIPEPTDPRMTALGDSYMSYAASKRFVMHYTQANVMRVAAKNGSRIISIAPGSFDTPMLQGGNDDAMQASIKRGTAFQRFGTSEEMADLIAKLVSPGHAYLTGVDYILDGGKTALSFAKQMM